MQFERIPNGRSHRFLTDVHTHKLTATLPVYPSKKDTSALKQFHTLRRNPWIAQISVDRATRSMNFAYDTILLAQTYMDELVISTNLKLNIHGRRSRQVPCLP